MRLFRSRIVSIRFCRDSRTSMARSQAPNQLSSASGDQNEHRVTITASQASTEMTGMDLTRNSVAENRKHEQEN